jgi:methylenetetrahydrofolate reductase (NADPH)
MNLLEWVPKSPETFLSDVQAVFKAVPAVSGINIPDILRLPTRSYQAAKVLLDHNIWVVPHIRACDQSPSATCDLIGQLVDAGLTHALIVQGDVKTETPPQGTTLETLNALRKSFPNLTLYAALDPYRSSFEAEIDYAHQKLQAGANGIFTQPFFDLKLASQYLKALDHTQVFLGISPVTTERSKTYWETQNKVRFPAQFQLDLDANIQLAKDLVGLAKNANQHTYMMPITHPELEFSKSVLGE